MVLFSLVAAKLHIPDLNHQKQRSQEYFMVKLFSDEERVWFLSSRREVLFEGKPGCLSFHFPWFLGYSSFCYHPDHLPSACTPWE